MDKKRLNFTAEQLRNAILEIRSGMSIRNAATEFGIPRSTLRNRMKNPFPNSPGPAPAFSKSEEDTFVTLLKGFDSFDLSLTRKRFIDMVKAEAKRKSEFLPFVVCYLFLSA